MLTVVAALIRHQGRFLICQRQKDDTFGLKWEFPGGKLKTGETPQQALTRELQEELGVAATIGPEVYRARHRYAEHATELRLLFYAASLPADSVRNLAFEQIVWEEPEALLRYDFLPADRELIELLAHNKVRFPE